MDGGLCGGYEARDAPPVAPVHQAIRPGGAAYRDCGSTINNH